MERGEAGILVSSAWLVELDVGGERRSYCIDASIPPLLEKPYRSIVFVYPSSICEPVPPPGTEPLPGLDLEEALQALLEGCRGAEEEYEALRREGRARVTRTPSLLLGYLAMLPPANEELARAEALNALQLCRYILDYPRSPTLLSAKKAYITYPLSDARKTTTKRLRAIAQRDAGLAARLSPSTHAASHNTGPG